MGPVVRLAGRLGNRCRRNRPEHVFWILGEEIAAESDVKRRVVDIFKKYNADMVKAGRPYRYG